MANNHGSIRCHGCWATWLSSQPFGCTCQYPELANWVQDNSPRFEGVVQCLDCGHWWDQGNPSECVCIDHAEWVQVEAPDEDWEQYPSLYEGLSEEERRVLDTERIRRRLEVDPDFALKGIAPEAAKRALEELTRRLGEEEKSV